MKLSLIVASFALTSAATLCVPLQAAPDTAPASAPATQPVVDPAATAAIKALIDTKRLRLATDAPTAADTFWFKFHLSLPDPAKAQPFDVVVASDKEKIGMLVVAADGLPFAYLTDGLLVRMDPANPGGLIVHTGGSASFTFGLGEGGPSGIFNYGSVAGRSHINANPAAILQGLLEKMIHANFDPAKHLVTAVTQRGARIGIEVAEKSEAYPLKTLVIGTGGTSRAGFGVVRLGVAPPFLIARDLKAFQSLQLPIRVVEDKDLSGLPAVPPSDFAKDPKERAAAEAMKSLFSGKQ